MIGRRELLGFSLFALLPAAVFARASRSKACRIGAPRLSARRIAPDGTVDVAIETVNPGLESASLLVQLYVHDHVASIARPALSLAAAQSVVLRAGERRTVRFTLTPETFRLPMPGEKLIVEPGLFDIMVGTSSRDLQSATLEIV